MGFLLERIRDLVEFASPFPEGLAVLRAIVGFILVFFLPGFAWTLVIFNQINILERIALSFGLSIALVVLGVFFLNLFVGVKITGFNSLFIIIMVTIVPLLIYLLNWLMRRRRGANGS